MADSEDGRPAPPYRSGWWLLAITLLLAECALGAIGGVLTLVDAPRAALTVQLLHGGAEAWLPIVQVAASLALVERVRRPGPMSWAGAVLALVPILALQTIDHLWWFTDWTLLNAINLALLGPLTVLGLLVLSAVDRAPGPAVHALILGPTALVALGMLLWPLALAIDVHLHDTLFITGTRHAVAAVPMLTVVAAVGVRWRPWSSLIATAAILVGTVVLALPQLQAGLRGIPARYPAMPGGPGWLPLLGGALVTLGLLLAAGLAVWRPARAS